MLTKIINIEARWGRSVTEFLPAGDYKVEYIGVAQGGQYNAWNYRYNYYPWWSNQYQIDSSEFSFSTGRLSENWGSDTLALANAKNTTFVLKNAGNVTFWIYDTVYDDNTGGISLRVTSIPTPATNITLSNSNIAENQAVNTVIGDFTSTDPDPGDTFTYSLVAGAGDTDNSFFTITGSQLRTKAVFDFETKKTYSIRVRTTDQDGQFYEKQLTVNVDNVIEPGTFAFSDNNYVVKEDGTVVKAITINRTDNFEGAVSVTVTPTDGTATSVNDYNNTPIVVNFAAGETSKTVNLPLINDNAYELDETVNLTITNVTGVATIGTKNKATLTILNDDAPIPGVLAFNAPTYSITENGTPITQVVVTRTGGSDTEVSGTITLSNDTATVADYNNSPIKVTFAHGDSTPKIITIPIKEDSQFEAVETIKLSLTNPTNGATIGLQNTAIVKIIDNDNFVFTNTDIKPTKLEKLTLPIPTALKQYETLSSGLDKAKVNLGITEEQLTLANDDYLFAKETFDGSLSKKKSLEETLKNLGDKRTALTSSFTQSQTQIQQKLKDIQKSIDDAYGRLKVETNADIKNGIQKEINGYLNLIQDQQNLLSFATTRYNQDLGVIDFQISESNQDLQALTSNIIPKQVEELEKKNQALVAVKTVWEANKQALTVADKALGDFLTDYAFLKTQDYSSKFLGDTVNNLNQKISILQANLTNLKNSNGSSSEISALEKAIQEKQKVVGEVQDYQKTVLAGEVEFKQELETRKATSDDHQASVKVALGSNNIEGYVTLSSQLANQLKGLTTVWVDDLQDNHNLTIKVWNGFQSESQAFDSLTSYIDQNLATPYGDYYLNEIQLNEALQVQESTVRRRDALADSVNFVTDALFLAKKQLQEYQDLAKLGQHYSDLTTYEKEFNQINVLESKLATISQFQQKLVTTTGKLISVKEDNKNKLALAGQKGAITRPETGNKYFWTPSTSWEDAQAQGEAAGGNLVTINDGNEQNWAIQIRPQNVGYFWLGLTDKFQEGRWEWISGEPITYTYWRPGEPNNHGGAENYGLVWINNEWNDGTNGSLPGLIEINLQSLAQKETTITQEVEKTRADFNNSVTDLLKFLDSPLLHNTESLKTSILQKQTLNDSYLSQAKWYLDQAAIYWEKSQKQGANWVEYTQVKKTVKKNTYWETVTVKHDDPNWVVWDDYTKKSQALQQQSADFLKSISDDVQTFINQSELVLQPKLINEVSNEVTNKAQDLVVQIDLTNDQQEQWIETNLQKYIEQKQNSIVKAQEAPLTAIKETFQQPTRALFFDGVNDYIQINLNEPETEVTHELWFNTTSLNGGLFSVVAGNLGSGGHDRNIYLSNGNIVVRVWNNEAISSSGLNLADGKWHHVAHVFGASVGGQQIYIDGQLVASGSRTISDFNWQDKTVVGYSADSGYFKGEIDEVRVWNVAKTQAQIQTYYNRNLTGKEQGLAGYWKFDETSGNTVYDLSGNNNNATLINGIQRTVANTNPITRPEGKALYFDGVNDYINAGTNASLEVTNTLTIEAWINPQKQIQADGGIIVNREGEYEVAVWSDGTIRWAFANSNPGWNWINTGYTISTDKWTHIAVSYDKGLIKTYANGSLVHTYDGTGTIGDVFASQDELRIGYRQAANSQYFKGQIDEVRVWNIARTQAEIQANLSQKLTGNEQGLVGYWNFEESTGNTVNDLTANKNNGTLINGVRRTVANSNPITRPEGKALYFDGVNDYISMGVKSVFEMTNSFTIEAWIKPQQKGNNGIIVSREGEYMVSVDANNRIYLALANTSPGWGWWDTGYTVAVDKWTHLAVTYDKGLIKVYGDGNLVSTYDGTGTIGDFYVHANEDDLRIGNQEYKNSDYFKGEMDEVRVWNVARTQAEIQANLSQKLTGNEQGLVGYWNFEESTGNTVNDLTANKNNGTLINGVQRTVENTNQVKYQPSNALYFDGINDSVKVSHSSSLDLVNQWTLEAWVFRNTTGRIDPIIEKYNWQAGFGGFNLRVTDTNKLIANVINGVNANAVESNITINSQQWYHVSATFDGSQKTLKLYVNGVLVGVNTDVTITPISSNVSLKIGERGDDLQPRYWYFNGQIDDVRVWNVARTQAEIQANLSQKLTGKEQGLVGYWNFEENTGNTINDLTANKNNGTLINGVQRTVANSNLIAKPEGKALFFDGVNDYIQMNLNEPETEVTHELWFKTTSLNGCLFFVVSGDASSTALDRGIYLSNGNIFANIYNAETISSSGLNLADGKWHHVAHVFGASVAGQQIYVDGQLVATGSKTYSDFNWQDKIAIGYSAYSSGYFKGEIDEVRVWNVAKTQSQIQASLSQKLVGNEQGLIGYWNFEESAGNTVYDLTANKNNGTLTNGLQRTIDSSIGVPQVVTEQTNLIESKTISDLQSLRLETAYLTLISQQNPDKAEQYLQEYQASDKTEATLQTLLNKYFPELNNPTTLATLQQQISDQQTQTQQKIDQLKNSISQKQAEAAASISQADWYQEKSAYYWEQSRKQGPTWIEWRTYQEKKWYGRKQTKEQAITHVDHNWIIWDTYTKQATALRQYADQLLKGVQTDTLNKDTTTTLLDQWNKAKTVADEAALTQNEFIKLLQQLEAERKLSQDKIAQINDWEKLLPVLQTQLNLATQDATTATNNVQKETGEYQTSKDNYLNALNSVLEKRAQLQTQTQLLQQDITTAKNWAIQQTTYLADELSQSQTLVSQLQAEKQTIAQQLTSATGEQKDSLLTEQAQLDQSIQLLTQKQTVLTAQQATLTQKQTLLSAQEQVLLTEYQLLDATLASPDKDTSTLEQQLADTRKTLAEVQKLAEQAEASSQALTAAMDGLQSSLLLQNDKYLAAIKDKQQSLKNLIDATELEKNYNLQATTKRQELNGIESQLITILKQANDAGSKEAAKLLQVANANNMATAAELYYKDYRDLASDKGGGCSGGIARPEDLLLADKYYAQMQEYRQLQQQAQQQASQFTALRQVAESQITLLDGQKALATQELAQLQQSIGNSQQAIEAHKQEIAVAEFRIDALSQLKDWTNQTLLQVLSVEKFNLAQAQLEQEIAQKRGQLIDDAVAAQLEKQRLDIQRDRQIAVTKLEQLNQLNTEQALQQAINNLRTDLGINPIQNIIAQADYKGQLAGILADLDALKQKQPNLPSELQSILTATRQDINAALQGKEAKTIQDNLLKTVDGLIQQNNKLNAEVTKLDQEEQKYLGILKQSETDLKGASKALYDEIQKTGVLDQEKALVNQQNLEILYKVGYANSAVTLSDDLAQQSQQLLSQIIDGRVKERRVRKKAFVNDILDTYARVYEITGTVLTFVGYVYPPAKAGASLAFIQAGFIRGVQAAYNGDWKGAMYQIGMASLKALALEYSGGGSIFGFSPSELQTLQQFQIGLSTAYNTYNAYKSENYALAFVSLAKGVAEIAAMEFQLKGEDGKPILDKDDQPILGGSALQKGIITLGQTSLDIYNTAQAIDNKDWATAIGSIANAASTVNKNFKTDIQGFVKENSTDLYELFYSKDPGWLERNIGLNFEQSKNLVKTINTLYDAHENGSYQSWYSAINNVLGLWGDEIKQTYDKFIKEGNSGSQGQTGSNNQDSQGSSGGNSGSTNQGYQDSSSGNSSNQSGQNQHPVTSPKMIEDEFQKIYAKNQLNNNPQKEDSNKDNNFVKGVSKGVEIFHDSVHQVIEEAVKKDPQLIRALKLGASLPASIGFAIAESAQDGQIKASEIIVNLGGDLFGAWSTKGVVELAAKVVAINPYVKVAMMVAGSEVGQQAFKYVYEKAEQKLPAIQEKFVSEFKKLKLSLKDPLVIDLNYDGIQLTNLATSSTFFDMDGDGYAENTAWVSPQDGILTIDLNGDGTINNITEIFSEHYGDGTPNSGLNAISTLDSTKNGIISASDDQFNQILVWQDLNQNGISEANELKTLTQLGITSINLNGIPTQTIQDGNIIRTRSIFNRNDGTIGQIADVAFLVTETGFKVTQTNNNIQIIAENNNANSLAIFNDNLDRTLNLADAKVQIAIGSTGKDNFYTTGTESVFLSGGEGDDILTGGSGNDWIIGDTGADQLIGGAGNDILYIDAADTLIDGGPGQDIAIVATTQGITLDLGKANLEMALGNDGNDTFTNTSAFSITIDGGKGDDSIQGGTGKGEIDTFTGGIGRDTFILGDKTWIGYDDENTTAAGDNDYALITDFNPTDDIIQLKGSSSDYLLTVSGANTNLYINKPGNEPDELIAIINNNKALSLTASYFSYVSDTIFHTPVEAVGNTKLVKDTTNKLYAQIGNNNPTAINISGTQITTNTYSGWQTLAAETVNGVNQVLWKYNDGNYLHLWSLDSNWNWQSSTGWWGLNSSEAFTQETNFQQDFNGDGIIGQPYTTIETFGNTKLVQDTTNKLYAQIGNNNPTAINISGTQITTNIYSGWQTLAAETVNGVNQVLWKYNDGNYLHLWTLDSNWNWQSSTGWWGLNSSEAFTQETNFQQDFNGDNQIGNPLPNIASSLAVSANVPEPIIGSSNDDILTGTADNDILVGGLGNDTITGGAGSDRFTFNNPNEGIDTITDFLSSQGDKITVSAAGFGGGLAAGVPLTSAQFVLGTAALNASNRFIYNTITGGLFFDGDGTGTIAAIQIATLSSKPTLAASDILVLV